MLNEAARRDDIAARRKIEYALKELTERIRAHTHTNQDLNAAYSALYRDLRAAVVALRKAHQFPVPLYAAVVDTAQRARALNAALGTAQLLRGRAPR